MNQIAIRGWRPGQQPAQEVRRRNIPLRSLALALSAALLMLSGPAPVQDVPALVPVTAKQAMPEQVFPPENILLGLPGGSTRLTIPTQHLLKGRMLLIDQSHPLPDGWQPAASVNILGGSGGRVQCRDTSATLGEEALLALKELFAAALNDRVIQLTVFAGTRSQEQQRQQLADAMDLLSRDMPLEDALHTAQAAIAAPGCSEHQTALAVDIRICPRWDAPPTQEPLEASVAGRWLIRHAWAYGFIRRFPEAQPEPFSCRAYHFRYVGKAHAMLMHALNVTLEEYLSLLRTHGAITLLDEENAPLATAVCQPAGERSTSFSAPVTARVEDASLDNTGWAVISCLYESSSDHPG